MGVNLYGTAALVPEGSIKSLVTFAHVFQICATAETQRCLAQLAGHHEAYMGMTAGMTY